MIVPDAECTAPRLADGARRAASPTGRASSAMGAAARSVGRPDAVAAVAALARAHARAGRGAGRSPAAACRREPGRRDGGRTAGAGPRPVAAPAGARGRRGRGGDERHRLGAGRHGPRRHGQRPEDLARARAAGRQRGARSSSATTPPTSADAEVVAVSTAIPDANPEVAEARRRGLTVLSRAEALAAIAALSPRAWRCRGPTARPRRRRCWRSILIEAGLRPSFLIGGDVNEIGTNAVWDTGEWLVVEADESDGTFLAARPRDRRGHQRRARPPRLLRGLRRSSSTAFDRFLAVGVGGRGGGRRRPVAAAPGRAPRRRPGRERARRHLPDRGPRRRRDGVSFALRARRRACSGACRCPSPGPTSPATRRWPWRRRCAVGAPFDAAAAGPGPLRRRGPALRVRAARPSGVRFVDDYAHLPTEVAAVIDAARATGAGPARGGVPAAPLQPDRRARASSSPTPSRAPTWWSSPTSSPAGEAPLPGVTGRVVADAVRRAHPDARRRLRRRARRAARPRGRRCSSPGDLCLTLGAGDLTSLPDELQAATPW